MNYKFKNNLIISINVFDSLKNLENKKVDLNFDGFKYLKEMQKQNIPIEEHNISINSFIEELDSCKYLIFVLNQKFLIMMIQ